VTVFNGEGGEYQGEISALHKRGAQILVQQFVQSDSESPLNIILAQGVSRGERMDFTVQKAVELGIRAIVPLTTSRTVVNLNAERRQRRREHWQAVVCSACEQSGRNYVPRVAAIEDFARWLPTSASGNRVVLNHRVNTGVGQLNIDPQQAITVLIGPEGGLSLEEIQLAEQHGFKSLCLGPRVLRTETAALAFIAAMQSRYGDFI
ncbi:16S rRNA (uracil(1498)-N(3))-methyltransferase, partial [Kaarinaea lacus]